MTRGPQQPALSRYSRTNCTVRRPPSRATQLTSLALLSKTSHTECIYGSAWHLLRVTTLCHPVGGTKLQVHIPLKVHWPTLADVSNDPNVLTVSVKRINMSSVTRPSRRQALSAFETSINIFQSTRR